MTGSVLEPVGYKKKRKTKEYTDRRLGEDMSNIGKSWRELDILARDSK
jgi:hypothetical protein